MYVCKRILIDKLCSSSFSLAALLFRTEICIVCSKIAMLTLLLLLLTVSHFRTHLLLLLHLLRRHSFYLFLIQYLFLIPSIAFSHVHSSFSALARSFSYPVSYSHTLPPSPYLYPSNSTPPFSSTIAKFLFGLEARTLLNTEFYCHTIYNYYVLHESVT